MKETIGIMKVISRVKYIIVFVMNQSKPVKNDFSSLKSDTNWV